MKVILHHRGRVAIDILGSSCRAAKAIEHRRGKSRRIRSSQPSLDMAASPSVEEGLFRGLLLLLGRHYKRAGGAPSRKIIGAANAILEELIERGRMPGKSPHDGIFLAKLLAILEQLATKPTRLIMTELIDSIRKLIIDDDNGSEPNDDEGSGNGHPKSGKPRPSPAEPDDDGTSGGNNGTPGGNNGTR